MFTIISALVLALGSANASSHAKAPPEPSGTLEGVISADDYPMEALEKNEQGDVSVVVHVDATGAISDCAVEKSSGSAILDKHTCDLIRERAKFKPALDRKGRPVASETHKDIHWRIAQDVLPSDPWALNTIIEFGPHREAVSCRVEAEGAVRPKSGYQPHPCPSNAIKDVSGETRFGGPIDRVTMGQRFAVGPVQMPPLGPDEELAGKEVYQVDVDTAGKVTSCKLTDRSGPPGPSDPCPALNKQFIPRKGADGKSAPFSGTAILTAIVHIDRSRPPYATPLNGSLQAIITGDDYPEEALDRGEQGKVDILVRTDPKGLVSDCVVENSSGSAILDNKTCALIRQRAKFKPALDRQGRAVAGEYRSRIEWTIAEDLVPSDPWVSRTIISFAPDGRPLSCRMELEGAIKPAPGKAAADCSPDDVTVLPRKFGDLPAAIGTMVVEQSFGKGRAPSPTLAADDVLLSRYVMSLDINGDGHLTSCKVVERSGAAADSDPCATIDKEYVPRAGPDGWAIPFTAIETVTVYVQVEKVALGAAPVLPQTATFASLRRVSAFPATGEGPLIARR